MGAVVTGFSGKGGGNVVTAGLVVVVLGTVVDVVEVDVVVLKTGKGKNATSKTLERWTGKCSHGHDKCVDVDIGEARAA